MAMEDAMVDMVVTMDRWRMHMAFIPLQALTLKPGNMYVDLYQSPLVQSSEVVC